MEIYRAVTRISSPILEETSEIYLIRSERNVLIDTGIRESPEKDIIPALAEFGMSVKDIDLVLNTHGHPDHTGGNAYIKNEGNAKIFIHSKDADFVRDHASSYKQFIKPVIEVILGKEALDDDMAAFLDMAGPDMEIDRLLEDNDRIELGKDCELMVIHMPGHTHGCVGYYWEKEGILFSGDSLPGLHTENFGLPIISGFKEYKATLERVREIPVRILLQAHPFRGLSLPPSPIKKGEEIDEYLDDCRNIAEWIMEAIEYVFPGEKDTPFVELADRVIARLPKNTSFIPMSQVPLPRYNALTILSAIKELNL